MAKIKEVNFNTETQITFFGNLNAAFKYDSIENEYYHKLKNIKEFFTTKETISRDIHCDINNYNNQNLTMTFEYQCVKDTEINLLQYADNYLNDIIYGHFHCRLKSKKLKAYQRRNLNFALMDSPLKLTNIKSFAPIELTIFRNGLYCCMFHFGSIIKRDHENVDETGFSFEQYLDSINRVDYLREDENYTAKPFTVKADADLYKDKTVKPGNLIRITNRIFSVSIVHDILNLLNHLELDVRSISDEFNNDQITKSEFYYAKPKPKGSKPIQKKGIETNIYRPFVGTYYILDKANKYNYNEIPKMENFAIAAARTTPEFLSVFKKPDKYLFEGNPTRDIFSTRNDIVYISQRGWCCIQYLSKLELNDLMEGTDKNRKFKLYRLEVIDNVTNCAQIIVSGVIAARNLQRVLNNHGRTLMIEMMDYRNRSVFYKLIKRRSMSRYIKFLHRLRIHSTSNEIYLNLSAYVKSYTAKAAAKRLIKTTSFQETVNNTRESFNNYNAFFVQFNQQTQRKNLILVFVTLFFTIIIGILNLKFNFEGTLLNAIESLIISYFLNVNGN